MYLVHMHLISREMYDYICRNLENDVQIVLYLVHMHLISRETYDYIFAEI